MADIKQLVALSHPQGKARAIVQSLAVAGLVPVTITDDSGEAGTFAVPAGDVDALASAMQDAARVCDEFVAGQDDH